MTANAIQDPTTVDAERAAEKNANQRIDWLRIMPFIALHVACIGVLFVGITWFAVGLAVLFYLLRMFFITGFYHRYFSHRAFKTSRAFQFVMACLACTSAQRGPLWWAAHHRHHHNHSDEKPDPHSPRWKGFLWSHMGWFLTRDAFRTDENMVRDWKRYPELVFLNRFDWLPVVVFAVGMFILGVIAGVIFPNSGINGWQTLVWGFVVSTIALYHATYTINSLAHAIGSRRFATDDDSRNNFLLALLTLGEGWHNNHHHYPASVRQGFYWWELDLTWYGIWLMSKIGLVWDLRPVPARVLSQHRIDPPKREDA